ncbi:MAG TPA: HlyD family efflux transporter periplasmic adaptor subunit [Planctomycetaceae bacterium]|nr:HlyD family efflux transporter periplasmic adaptor subunit [Planctomycetaceae bacterium]
MLLGGITAALVLAGLFAVKQKFAGPARSTAHLLTEAVERGPFRLSVIERGTLGSLRNSTLVNTVEGNTTIIFVVPEGTQVKAPVRADADGTVAEVGEEQYGRQTLSLRGADEKRHTFTGDVGGRRKVLVKPGDVVRVGDPLIGDVVCELDSSLLVQQEITQQIKVTTADAEVKKSVGAVEIQEHENASLLATARLTKELAELDLKKYQDGEFAQLDKQYTGELFVAREELNQARENYDYSKRVAKKGFKSQNELEAARIAELRARNKVEDASEKLKVLQEYDYRRRIRELEELAAQSVREIERIRLSGEAALAQFKAQLEASQLAYQGEKATLERLQRQIAACRLVAPQDGQVVYAVERSRRSEPVVIEEGATVRERQAIINLPDFSQMKVDVKVHESKIGLIREGLPALVRVLSEQGRSYRGVLDDVSDVPVRGDYPNYDLMLYECVVRITDDVQDLKPGLTAEVEIVSQDRDDVLQAPVQSIVAVGEKYFAWALSDEGPFLCEGLQLGPANDTTVEILAGLEEGQRVVMNPRTQFSKQLAQLEAKYKPAPPDAGVPVESDPESDPFGPPTGPPDRPLAMETSQSQGSATPAKDQPPARPASGADPQAPAATAEQVAGETPKPSAGEPSE